MEVAAVLGTEIAQLLSSQTKITGSFQLAARLSDSWNAPMLVAPSPSWHSTTPSSPR